MTENTFCNGIEITVDAKNGVERGPLVVYCMANVSVLRM